MIKGCGGQGKGILSYCLSKYLSMNSIKVGYLSADCDDPNVGYIFNLANTDIHVDSNGKWTIPNKNADLKVLSYSFFLSETENRQIPEWDENTRETLFMKMIEMSEWQNTQVLIVDMPNGNMRVKRLIELLCKYGPIQCITITSPHTTSVLRTIQLSLLLQSVSNVKILGCVINMHLANFGGRSKKQALASRLHENTVQSLRNNDTLYLGTITTDSNYFYICNGVYYDVPTNEIPQVYTYIIDCLFQLLSMNTYHEMN
ncbi:hypothetical protein WA158_000357 [Blastocystis sp. Blastoise]